MDSHSDPCDITQKQILPSELNSDNKNGLNQNSKPIRYPQNIYLNLNIYVLTDQNSGFSQNSAHAIQRDVMPMSV